MIARSLTNELKDSFNDGFVWSVEVSVEGVYRDTVLMLALKLLLARVERKKPRRCIEAETVAWSSKQLGEISCSLDNDELVGACEASLLQSFEAGQLRLSQVPRTGAGHELSQLASRVTSAMHADSSNGDEYPAKVKSLISEMSTRRVVTEMQDADESELPGHVEEMEFQVSFSIIDAQRQSTNSQRESGQLRLDVDGPAGLVHPEVQFGRNVSQLDGQSQDEMGTLTTRLQGVREPQWQRPP